MNTMKTRIFGIATISQYIATIFLLCTISVCSLYAQDTENEGQFDIYFRNCHDDDDPNAQRTRIDSIIASTTYSYGYVESIEDPINIYNSYKTLQLGAKIGRSHEIGSLTINLAEKCQVRSSKLAFYLAHYYNTSSKNSDNGPLKVTVTYTDGTTAEKVINIEEWADGKELNDEGKGFYNHQTMILSAEKYIQKIKLETTQTDYGRVYCKYFSIFRAPIVSKATVTTQQTNATLTCPGITDFGSEHFSVIDYGFVVSTSNTNPTIGATGVTKYSCGEVYATSNTPFSTTLTNLTPGITYYVRPYVRTTQLNVKNDTCTAYNEETIAFRIEQYTVQWLVDREEYTVGNPTTIVNKGCQVTELPTDPAPKCGEKFVGWTNAQIIATQDNRPAILFKTAKTSPEIYQNTIFHAVFADTNQQ